MKKRLSYDALAHDRVSLAGWTLDQLIDHLVDGAAQGSCDQCTPMTPGSTCVHAAAQALRGMRRMVEHPDDCPDCARIHVEVV